jgi:hypothetical protein
MSHITLEKLALALMELKNENNQLKTELNKVKDYLREQHKLKNKIKK